MTPQPIPAQDKQGRRDERRPLRDRLTGGGRVWILNLVLSVLAATFYFGKVRYLPALHGPFHVPWWALAIMFYLAEVYVVHLQIRRDAHSFSLSELPIVLGLYF